MLEELNIMKLNFEVKHRFDFSGTLKSSARVVFELSKYSIVLSVFVLL